MSGFPAGGLLVFRSRGRRMRFAAFLLLIMMSRSVVGGSLVRLVEHLRFLIGLLLTADAGTESESEEAKGGGLVHESGK